MPVRPTPPRLFEEFEAGEITREQLHAGLAWHARELVDEIIEFHENPAASWWETMLARRTAARWASRHGIWRIRHIFAALAKLDDFEPARFLWQALHADVPLHCFFRLRTEPIFRLRRIEHRNGMLHVEVEHGERDEGLQRDRFVLEHCRDGLIAHPKPAG